MSFYAVMKEKVGMGCILFALGCIVLLGDLVRYLRLLFLRDEFDGAGICRHILIVFLMS